MGENQKIVLDFENARHVRLPKKVTEELKGIEVETWPGYPETETILLGRLVSYDSPEGQTVEESYPVFMGNLLNILEEKKLNFSRKWIEQNFNCDYIRVEKDCIRQ